MDIKEKETKGSAQKIDKCSFCQRSGDVIVLYCQDCGIGEEDVCVESDIKLKTK